MGAYQQAITWTINTMESVVAARRYTMEMALSMGFSLPDATKIAVVVSELGRNILLYAQVGKICVTPTDGPTGKYIEVLAEDHGPGIENVERVLQGGYTTSNGMGKGISGSRKLMDEFELNSVVGQGTTIRAVKYLWRKY